MSNTLIIGLGGTGGKIIREFRKRYFEEFKNFEPQDGCCIDYLYVDSDEGDLRTSWRTQGVSIGLSNSQKVSTHGMNISDLDQLEDRPQLQGFISVDEVDLIKLPAKNTDGFNGKVEVAGTSYVDQYTQAAFAATEYSFKAHIFKASDIDRYEYRNDAVYALLLESDGMLYPANENETEIQTYNPSRQRTIVVARAIDKSGHSANVITKKVVF